MPANPTGGRTYSIVEASNPALKERYLFVTPDKIFEAIAGFKRSPPETVRHWREHLDQIEMRSIAFEVSLDDGAKIIEEMRSRPLYEGWRYLVDDPDDASEAKPASR